MVHNLVLTKQTELNGEWALLVGFDKTTGTWNVTINGKDRTLKPEHLTKASFVKFDLLRTLIRSSDRDRLLCEYEMYRGDGECNFPGCQCYHREKDDQGNFKDAPNGVFKRDARNTTCANLESFSEMLRQDPTQEGHLFYKNLIKDLTFTRSIC